MRGIGVNDLIFGLRRSQLVVIDLLELVLAGEFGPFGRLLVPPVVEALRIGRPVGAGELHPTDHVVEHAPRGHLLDEYLHPVGTRPGDPVGHVFPVLGKGYAAERRRAVFRERIGIEEDLRLRIVEAVEHVEHALVLQPVVAEIEVAVADLRGSAYLLVVPQLREAGVYLRAIGNLRKIIERHLVLGRHPGCRFGGIVILQPAVGIGYRGAVIVVRHVDLRRLRIGFGLDLHSLF